MIVLYDCPVVVFQFVFLEVFEHFSWKTNALFSPIEVFQVGLPLPYLPTSFNIRCGASEIQNRRGFDLLKQGQQDIINKLLAGQLAVSKDVAKLLALSTDAIITEIGTSEGRIAARMEELDLSAGKRQANLVAGNQRTVFLDSLRFPEMLDRVDGIENRINDFGTTCSWIFDEGRNREHGFLDWLESSSGVYWISGKPGSGKSSIMDYIIQNVQEHDVAVKHISHWALRSKVLVLSHFFFALGKNDL